MYHVIPRGAQGPSGLLRQLRVSKRILLDHDLAIIKRMYRISTYTLAAMLPSLPST